MPSVVLRTDSDIFTAAHGYADPKSWHETVAPLRRDGAVIQLTGTGIEPAWAVLRREALLRTAQQDSDLVGTPIHRGDRVLLSYPSANRDETVFDNAFRFDVGRENADQQIAFGYGRHYCLGAHLARAEVKKFFEKLLPRLKRLEATGPCVHLASPMVSGPLQQPISYTLL